jgi:hypothetical protein
MDRRLFLTGLLGVVGATGIAAVLPHQAEALAAVPLGGPAPKPDDLLPKLPESGGQLGDVDDGWEPDEERTWMRVSTRLSVAGRRRRWRRVCRRWWHNGHWRRRCRRRPYLAGSGPDAR